jgi:hypothetical protein
MEPGHILAAMVKLHEERGTFAVVEKEELGNFLGDAGYLPRRPTPEEWKTAVKEIRRQIDERRERERQGEAGEGVDC